jgi:hypothetical protein
LVQELPLSDKASILDFFKARASLAEEIVRELDPADVVAELNSISGKKYTPYLLLLLFGKIECPHRPKYIDFEWINLSEKNIPAFPSRQSIKDALQITLKLMDLWDTDVIKDVLGETKISEPLHMFWKRKMPRISVTLDLVNDGNVYELMKRSTNPVDDEFRYLLRSFYA